MVAALPAAAQSTILGTRFFPTVLGGPFSGALHLVFGLAAALAFVAALCAYLRGPRFVYDEQPHIVAAAAPPASPPSPPPAISPRRACATPRPAALSAGGSGGVLRSWTARAGRRSRKPGARA